MFRILAVAAVTYGACCLALFLSRNRLVFPIRGGTRGDPAQFGIRDGQAVAIPVSDGVTIAGWFLPAVPAPSGRAAVRISPQSRIRHS